MSHKLLKYKRANKKLKHTHQWIIMLLHLSIVANLNTLSKLDKHKIKHQGRLHLIAIIITDRAASGSSKKIVWFTSLGPRIVIMKPSFAAKSVPTRINYISTLESIKTITKVNFTQMEISTREWASTWSLGTSSWSMWKR